MSYIKAGGNSIACPSFIGNTAGTAPPVITGNYVAEDGVTNYVTEDGLSDYVTE